MEVYSYANAFSGKFYFIAQFEILVEHFHHALSLSLSPFTSLQNVFNCTTDFLLIQWVLRAHGRNMLVLQWYYAPTAIDTMTQTQGVSLDLHTQWTAQMDF